MLRQYGPQRFRLACIRDRQLPVGTMAVGDIVRFRGERAIIEGFNPREIGAGRRTPDGRWASAFVARGGHLVQARRLRDGARLRVADHLIRDHEGE